MSAHDQLSVKDGGATANKPNALQPAESIVVVDNQDVHRIEFNPVEKKTGVKAKSTRSTRRNAGQNCRKCFKPDNMQMVACDKCLKWYHFVCVGVDQDVSKRDWKCDLCQAAAATLNEKSVKSKATTSKSARLALEKIEAERQLRDKLAHEELLIQKKYIEKNVQTKKLF